MTRNELFKLCIAGGFTAEHINEHERAFEALMESAIANERERLAKFCEQEDVEGEPEQWRSCAFYLANCIRSFDWDEYGEASSSL